MERVYPDHIYCPIRRAVAIDYLRRELRKYFGQLPRKSWSILDQEIARWFDRAPYFYPVRDFWNGFWGIAMGFKLKIGLLDFITAENISWQKEELAIDQLYFGGPWPSFSPTKENKYSSVKKVSELFRQPEILKKEKELIADWRQRAPKGKFPLIITEKKWDGQVGLVVYDGNARLSRAIIAGEKKIIAWVGRFTDQTFRPRNFWLATPLLIELTVRARQFWSQNSQRKFKNLVKTIKLLVADSQSGYYELKNRALWGSEEFIEAFWREYGDRGRF